MTYRRRRSAWAEVLWTVAECVTACLFVYGVIKLLEGLVLRLYACG